MSEHRERAIEDHGIIGDQRTAALVATDGTIDFLCWPRFDSPSVFAAILDRERGGAFELAPCLDGVRRRQMYLPGTAVLLTRFLSTDGVAEVSDFMAWGTTLPGQRLVRRAKAVRGRVRFRMRCDPRPDYARGRATCERDGSGAVTVGGPDGEPMLRLVAERPVTVTDGGAIEADFTLEHGESAYFVLEHPDCAPFDDGCAYVGDAFKETTNAWRAWSDRTTYRGRWRDAVDRSALTLKLLTSAEHGSILAAPTFGLPEAIGGARNWDYRYVWIRDAAFSVYAFLRVGHTAEADAFVAWLARCPLRREEEGEGPLGILYGLDGHRDLAETELDHLGGHHGSRPVRVGNDAAGQLQLDIYGEALDAIYLADAHGREITHEAWGGVTLMVDWLVHHWHEPDEGIWEPRGGRSELLHSRLMCWVAFDRALRLAEKRSLPAPVDEWRRARDAIHRDIHANFWDADRGVFVQSRGSSHLDASCLLMPLVRFIAPTDPRWLSTLRAVGDELTDDSLVFRHDAEAGDGIDGTEGTFNMCSFWYVECLARAGDVAQARYLFDKMLGYANHLGLFAEETGAAGDQLGNFPQAFTHMALISAAIALDRALEG